MDCLDLGSCHGDRDLFRDNASVIGLVPDSPHRKLSSVELGVVIGFESITLNFPFKLERPSCQFSKVFCAGKTGDGVGCLNGEFQMIGP